MTENNEYNSHLRIGELPVLKVVPAKKLVFHEDPDRARLLILVDRLGSEKILKNPPIVAKVNGGKQLVILDGANRVTALLKLGFKHLLVQMVRFDDSLLSLHCWHHAIEKFGEDYFLDHLGKLKDVEFSEHSSSEPDENHDSELLRSNGLLCNFTFSSGRMIGARNGGDVIKQVGLLKKITDLYLTDPHSDRVSYVNLEHLKKHYPDFRTLLTFRRFTKADFSAIVAAGIKLPAGITRVFLPKRALGLNVPLEFLRSSLTLEEKNRWVDDMILKKVREKSIRFYREPTFAFDE